VGRFVIGRLVMGPLVSGTFRDGTFCMCIVFMPVKQDLLLPDLK
jgi:hypothetical protein